MWGCNLGAGVRVCKVQGERGKPGMTDAEFAARVIAMQDTLYRVSTTILPRLCDREDAVQSAIEKAWRKADSLREPNKLKPWLVRILVNECHEVLRRRKREIPTENLPEESAPPPQEQRELRELVMSLPENERLPIVLHYLEGFSTQEIASALRCPKGTVLSRMSRGRRQLKRFLTEE